MKEKPLPNDDPITHDQVYHGIGRLSVHYSGLDFFIEVLTFALFPATRRKSGSTLGSRLEFLDKRQSKDATNPEVFDELKAHLPDLIEIAKERNRILHDQWAFAPKILSQGKVQLARIHLEKSAEKIIEWKTFRLAYFEELAERVLEAQGNAMDLVNKLGFIPLPCGGKMIYRAKEA